MKLAITKSHLQSQCIPHQDSNDILPISKKKILFRFKYKPRKAQNAIIILEKRDEGGIACLISNYIHKRSPSLKMEDTRKQKAKKKQAALDQDPEINSQSFSHLIPVKGINH